MQNKHSFKVWDKQGQFMTKYTTEEVYKITVNYPHTHRTLEFIGMDRGSCILQAEVAKEEDDSVMLMISENTVKLLQKEKMKI
tara:strand:+ start:1775 stop:2023 length:249 start_codon:yes stop_codon:yes gene_type:complete